MHVFSDEGVGQAFIRALLSPVLSQAEKDLAEGLSGATAVSLGRALFPGWADSNDNGVKRFAKSHRA